MKILRCHKCGALGVGPRAIKLHPMNGVLYCTKDWRDALEWEEQREYVTRGIQSLTEFHEAVREIGYALPRMIPGRNWLPYIQDLCGLAAWGLLHDDEKIFVYYTSRAVWAWHLSEVK